MVNGTDKKYMVEGRAQICDVTTIELTELWTRSIYYTYLRRKRGHNFVYETIL